MTRSNTDVPTAAEALEIIAKWEDLPLQRRRALAHAVNTLCRVGGKRHPATVRLDPVVCLPALDAASAVALGIGERTHRNVRAGLRDVLRRLGLLAPVRRREPIHDTRWATLIEALPARFHPHRLRAFLEFCAAAGVAPEAVTVETLVAYLRHREATRGGTNCRADVREAARQWNKMRDQIPGWPEAELSLPAPEGLVRSLPFSIYPASLQAEIDAYLAWVGRDPEDALDGEEEGGDPLSPETVDARRTGLRLLLWGLVETGRAPETLTRLSELVEFGAARQTLVWHRKRLGTPDPHKPERLLPTAGTAVFADTLQSLAVHFRVSGEPLTRLRHLFRAMRPRNQKEITDELDALLGRLAEPAVETRLLLLPMLLMRQAQRLRDGWTSKAGVNHPPKPLEACWRAALAVALEIELHLPLRIHDLARLRLGEELFFTAEGRGRRPEVRLRVTANKNRQVVETVFGPGPASLIGEYLQAFRPLGPHPTTAWLFPNRDRTDAPRSKGGFGEAIAGTVAQHTGVRVNVHAFRAYAATRILEDNPQAIEDVRVILGHASFEMALRHYRRQNRAGAAARLAEGLSKRRRSPRLTAAKARLPLTLALAGRSFGRAP